MYDAWVRWLPTIIVGVMTVRLLVNIRNGGAIAENLFAWALVTGLMLITYWWVTGKRRR